MNSYTRNWTKAWLSQLVNFKNAIWTWGHFRRTICNKILFWIWKKMPQKRMECFRLLLEHLAWIEHQFLSRIRDSRKAWSLDDERCGRSKEVRTAEFIGQIKNFMNKDRPVSIETVSAQFDVSVGTVHTIIREELKMRKICVKFVQRFLREDQKERRCHDSRKMVELIISDPAVLDALVTCDESWIYCYDPDTKRQSSQRRHAGSPRPKKARQSKSTHKLLMISSFFFFFLTALAWSTCTGFPLDRQSTKNTILRF